MDAHDARMVRMLAELYLEGLLHSSTIVSALDLLKVRTGR